MSIKNFYPQFPEISYKRTKIDMTTVVLFARSIVGKYPKEVVRMAYAIFRNESGNGSLGVNGNFAGIQADNDIWTGLDLKNVVGTCIKTDGNNETRRFLCFNDNGYQTSFDFLCFKIQQRNMYAEVTTPGNLDEETFIPIATNLYHLYQQKWVSNPSEDTADALKNLLRILV